MNPSRREFVKIASLAGAALVLGIPLEADGALVKLDPAKVAFEPSQWLKIDPSGKVFIMAHKCEMGQGVRTSLPMMVAEELDADWSRVEVVQASPSPQFGMGTGGSGSVTGSWQRLRTAGAAAREMLVSAAAQAWKVEPSTCRAENGAVVHEPTKRRLTYGELTEAAAKLPVPQTPKLKDPKEFRLIGQRIKRVDGPAIVAGRAEYGIDVRVPGMRVASLVRCPTVGGKAVSFDAREAKAVPGVSDVVQISNGVAVVADSTWTAFKARDLLKITWDDGPNRTETTETLVRKLETAFDKGGRATRTDGDAKKALDGAARKFEAEYRHPFQAHAAVEPLSCIALVGEKSCEIWAGTQSPNNAQAQAAKLLGIKPEDVKVHVKLIGGGFGRRLGVDFILEAVEIARAVKGPVQLVWTREDDIRQDFLQSAAIDRVSAGLDAEGNLISWIHRTADFHLSMFGPFDPNDPDTFDEVPWGTYDNPYEIPNLQVLYSPVESPIRTGAWRAVTYPAGVFSRESFIDEIAAGLKRDPLQFRLDLLKKTELLKLKERYVINRAKLRRVLELAASKAGWGKTPAAKPGTKRGLGVACNVYHSRTSMAQVADVSVDRDNRIVVHKVVCAVDCGQVVNPSGLEGQIESGVVWGLSAALKTRVTFDKGRIEQSNFVDFPVLRMDEAPDIEVHVVPSTEHPSGLGEQPVPIIYPAVANAVFAATGKRLRRLPLDMSDE